jgi:hypothetical protein
VVVKNFSYTCFIIVVVETYLELFNPTTWAVFRRLTQLPSATATYKFGERAFSYAGPQALNSFPPSVHSLTDLKTFKKQPKTHLFTTSFNVL